MISAKTVAVVALLGLAGVSVGQEKAHEQRIAELIEQLREDPKSAAETLGLLGAAARDAVPALLALLDDPDDEVLIAAVRALGQIGPHDPKLAVEIETELWENPFVWGRPTGLRTATVRALGRLWIDPRAKTNDLIAILQTDDHPDSRARAAEILGGRAREAEKILPALRAAMAARHPNRVDYVRFRDGMLGNTGIVRFVGTPVVTLAAARAIRALVPPGEEGEGVAVTLLREGTKAEALQSVYMQRQIAVRSIDRWVLGLCYRLDDADGELVRELVAALGTLGSKATHAIPRLEGLVEHEDSQIAARARAALRVIRG